VTGAKAQKRAQQVGIALSVLLVLVGLYTVYAFVASSRNSSVIRHGTSKKPPRNKAE